MRLIRNTLIVITLLVLGASAAYYYWFMRDATAGASHSRSPGSATEERVVEPPLFAALEPFTVTLNDQRGPHILYIEMTLQLADKDSFDLLTLYMPEVRDRVLAELAKHQPGPVQTPEGRLKLASSFKRVLSRSYHADLPEPGIDRVLFTAFVVQ